MEGHPLTPLIQKRVSALPPVLIVLAVTGFGVPFGLAGVFFAAPLLRVVLVSVRMLYVEDVLGDRPESGRGTAGTGGERSSATRDTRTPRT